MANSKMGRPRKEIGREQFEKLCGMMCTEQEICGFFGVSDETLNRWCKNTYDGKTFMEAFKIYSADGRISLRRMQWKIAERNAAMAIFLGKQYLGQRDVPEAPSDANELLVTLTNVLQQKKPD